MSKPLPVGLASSPSDSNARPGRPSRRDSSTSRSAINARLASPVPSSSSRNAVPATVPTANEDNEDPQPSPLPGRSEPELVVSGPSALSSALNASSYSGRASPSNLDQRRAQTPPLIEHQRLPSNYGSFAPSTSHLSAGGYSPKAHEDFDVVRRHLAGPVAASASNDADEDEIQEPGESSRSEDAEVPENQRNNQIEEEGFSSLRMQGGDITREIYRRTEAEASSKRRRMKRSQSYSTPQADPEDEDLDYENMRKPGGFRRNHLRRNIPNAQSKPSTTRSKQSSPYKGGQESEQLHRQEQQPQQPQQPPPPFFLTRNFYEFLSLYGHFAGEEFEDDSYSRDQGSEALSEGIRTPIREVLERHSRGDEETPLLGRSGPKRRRTDAKGPKKGVVGTALILLKSFVGTGVLFLPRAFYNGGMLFSALILFGVSMLSYYCFLLLTTSRLKLKGSFAEMGDMVFGRYMRNLINSSLVISQIGFASAYIVFTSENLQAFVLAVSQCRTFIDIKLIILMQLVIFLPLSLYRNLNNISIIVYIADIFIVLGLVYLYYFGISTIVEQGGAADIINFNRQSWPLFMGTAIFTFEGIGLIVPIQDGMKRPQQLPGILGVVMVIITAIFISMGALSYAAYGSKTKTVIILNMPQDNKFVNGVQFIYSLAILLSTPMQIFPAITIMEKGLFTQSGKHDKHIKWRKNLFRFVVVMAGALIAWIGADDLDKFVSLVGSFACIPLVYIYPVSHIFLFEVEEGEEEDEKEEDEEEEARKSCLEGWA
ncbi:MAG: neutral amino acid transporter [Alyxoria varia]|nr:MAG: neutral amino acid transporter [Alyxoria varia]